MGKPLQELFSEVHCAGSCWACVTTGVDANVRRMRIVEYIERIGGCTWGL